MLNTPTDFHRKLVTWHLTDSALPTGGFAHSAGLETFVQDERVHDPNTFSKWLHGYLRQASFNDALAVKCAVQLHENELNDEGKLKALRDLDALLHACQAPKQVRASMNSMGRRMAKIASFIAPEDFLVTQYAQATNAHLMHGNPGIASGLALAASNVSMHDAVSAYLMQMANSITQNAIRAIPLGQDAGQQILVGAYPIIEKATQMTISHDVSDLGCVAPQLEIAQMAHEDLRSRMFMS
uniref:urease accessory protein UreF n=1 Tax=Vaginimicrobium propionicum TaxID=1871034 RepID=UPI0009707EF3|nr:urease accessory UreF family protein [Vaginimicrobium propionicum]